MKRNSAIIIVLMAVIVGLLATLASSIVERKYEVRQYRMSGNDLTQDTTQNSKWGQYYPYQYQSFLAATKEGDESTIVHDELAANPGLVFLWGGYGFSKDYNKPRGHTFAVVDTINSLRTGAPADENSGPMPATCWTCKSPDVPRVMKRDGVDSYYTGKWARHGKDIVNPIGCADCHDAQTMELKLSRPALVEALRIEGVDLERVRHSEMKNLVCAQCHVEYYFTDKETNKLKFPWDKGTKIENVISYYDDIDFKDWTHGISKAPMLKAQHPGYELFKEGIHYKRGVSCVDCHMPYKTEGGVKYTDHHVQSPLQNVQNSCQQCHRADSQELISNVMDLKEKMIELKSTVEKMIIRSHFEAKKAWELGASKKQMESALKLIRHAQMRWDYATAAHGAFFHAPEEVLRILGLSIKNAADAREELGSVLRGLGFNGVVNVPDYSSKEKAQEYMGLNIAKEEVSKKEFIKNTVEKKWLNKDNPNVDKKYIDYVTPELDK
ncbi:ammonia-forming cytochrome c nitrite reductase [Halobacteriovorax sp.]|uniref:ammonia-forming cytochrome c nitrite reductase n=1 Tax=Halobacteriovorax sp. TaxID=2020862 RepID=UPI003AF2A91D